MNRRIFLKQFGGLAGSVLLPISVSGLSRLPVAVRIAQLADTHIGPDDAAPNSDYLRTAVDKVNAADVDMTVICGDLLHMRSLRNAPELKSILSGLERPYLLLPGNHDVGMIPAADTLGAFRTTIGRDYQERNVRQVKIVAVNTQLWAGGPQEEREVHDSWLRSVLNKQRKDSARVVVCGHMPLFINNPDEKYKVNVNIEPAKRKKILELFASCNVSAYLCGHLHCYSAHTVNNMKFTATEPVCSGVCSNNEPGFRLWEFGTDSEIPVNTFVKTSSS